MTTTNESVAALRRAAKEALEALDLHADQYPHMIKGYTVDACRALRAALAALPATSAGEPADRTAFERVVLPLSFYPRNSRIQDDGRYVDDALQTAWELWRDRPATPPLPSAKRVPLTEAAIVAQMDKKHYQKHERAAGRWGFIAGVRWAEAQHGITESKEAGHD